MCAQAKATKRRSDGATKGNPNPECGRRGNQSRDREGADRRLSIARVVSVIVLTMCAGAHADEVISRAWTIQNVLEPTFTEAISRAETIQNVLEPAFTEAISQAVTECNVGIFADEDDDTVHDCLDVCPGGDDLIDNDSNNIPDACEPGSCCIMVGGIPGCFNSNKLECESPPFNGVYGGEGSSCTQNIAIIHEPSGEVFIHVIGPPATCNTGGPPPICTPSATAGITPPPRLDAWKTYGTLNHSFSAAVGGTPIPSGFFGTGSDAFESSIGLQGVSLNDPEFPGADTIVRRHGDPFDLCSPFPATADPVPIEIVALSLANPSSAPLVVTYGGANPEEWDVTVGLGGTAPMGTLTATKEHCNGGTYTSVLNVLPQFTFRRRSNGTLRGLIPPTHMVFDQTEPAPWVHEVDPAYDAAIDPCSTFHAGWGTVISPATCGDDPDQDGLRAECDNCPNDANVDQLDTDDDGIGDVCDNCPLDVNPGQEDCDNNGEGDLCGTAFTDCQPNGIPDDCETAPVPPIKQNLSDTGPNSVGCWNSGSQCSRLNGWARCFPITEETFVDGVVFGVRNAGGPPWTITVRLWQDNDGSCPPSSTSTATVVRQQSVQVTSAQQGQLVTVPISPRLMLSPGEHVIAEVENPDGCVQVGFGALFFIMMNELGETAPSYLRTNVCTPLDWATHASFGFPTYSTVLYLRTGPPTPDDNENGIPDECEIAPPPEIVWDDDPLSSDRTTRSLRFSLESPVTASATPGQSTIKVTMAVLQNPDPPNLPQFPPPDFSAYESGLSCTDPSDCARWVGRPSTFYESQGPPLTGPYRAARLQCTPFYWDWVTETATDPIVVVGAEIVPSSEYSVQTYASSCKGVEGSCTNVSTAVTMYTRRSGDVDSEYNPPSTTNQPNAIDVAQVVNKFKNIVGAPIHARAQLQPNLPELNASINALDIVAVVDGVKGFAYAFSGPCPCPSTVTCGGSCTGCPGMCVKTCTGGDNDGEPCVNSNHCPSGTCAAVGTCRDQCGRCTP